MAAISLYLKLCQNCNHIKWADPHKEQFEENQKSKSIFGKEIC